MKLHQLTVIRILVSGQARRIDASGTGDECDNDVRSVAVEDWPITTFADDQVDGPGGSRDGWIAFTQPRTPLGNGLRPESAVWGTRKGRSAMGGWRSGGGYDAARERVVRSISSGSQTEQHDGGIRTDGDRRHLGAGDQRRMSSGDTSRSFTGSLSRYGCHDTCKSANARSIPKREFRARPYRPRSKPLRPAHCQRSTACGQASPKCRRGRTRSLGVVGPRGREGRTESGPVCAPEMIGADPIRLT